MGVSHEYTTVIAVGLSTIVIVFYFVQFVAGVTYDAKAPLGSKET